MTRLCFHMFLSRNKYGSAPQLVLITPVLGSWFRWSTVSFLLCRFKKPKAGHIAYNFCSHYTFQIQNTLNSLFKCMLTWLLVTHFSTCISQHAKRGFYYADRCGFTTKHRLIRNGTISWVIRVSRWYEKLYPWIAWQMMRSFDFAEWRWEYKYNGGLFNKDP